MNDNNYILKLEEGEEQESVNLAGYEVAKAELFAHSREPAITVWNDKIKFSPRRESKRTRGGMGNPTER